MQTRQFGQTGLTVSALGLGAGSLGDASLSDGQVERLIHGALDLGINLIDTARSYGASEARIGRALRGRRRDAVLSTKLGYGVPGVRDWTGEAVRLGIDDALRSLETDCIDIVHLHSCSAEVLREGQVTEALSNALAGGKVRVAAYSGEGDALAAAVASNVFGSVQFSLNPWDQSALDGLLGKAKDRGLGVIAKRPLANAWWSHANRPERADIAHYWDRGRTLAIEDGGLGPAALALRFVAFTWGVDAAIVGTQKPAHLAALAAAVAKGPLPPELTAELRQAWHAQGQNWAAVL